MRLGVLTGGGDCPGLNAGRPAIARTSSLPSEEPVPRSRAARSGPIRGRMLRHAGWIALHSGLAGGADVILVPERPIDLGHVADAIRVRHDRGSFFSIVVVAEGAKLAEGLETVGAQTDEFGHERLGGIGDRLA